MEVTGHMYTLHKPTELAEDRVGKIYRYKRKVQGKKKAQEQQEDKFSLMTIMFVWLAEN